MTIIGTFSPTDAGGFNGGIRTLTFQGKLTILPTPMPTADSDYVVFAGPERVGQAWRRPDSEGRLSLWVRLEHPSFAEPVDAELASGDPHGRVYHLTWRRRL